MEVSRSTIVVIDTDDGTVGRSCKEAATVLLCHPQVSSVLCRHLLVAVGSGGGSDFSNPALGIYVEATTFAKGLLDVAV